MKKLSLTYLCIFLLSLSSVYAQTKEQELSNAEKFSARSGTLIQKEFIEIGKVKGVVVKVVHYNDLINNTKQSAIILEYEYVGKYSSSTKSAILDSDELDGLIKSITVMQERIFPSTSVNYTEVYYKSRAGFEAGCYWSKDNWSTYLKLEKYDKDSYVFLNKEDFPALLGLIEKAKAKL